MYEAYLNKLQVHFFVLLFTSCWLRQHWSNNKYSWFSSVGYSLPSLRLWQCSLMMMKMITVTLKKIGHVVVDDWMRCVEIVTAWHDECTCSQTHPHYQPRLWSLGDVAVVTSWNMWAHGLWIFKLTPLKFLCNCFCGIEKTAKVCECTNSEPMNKEGVVYSFAVSYMSIYYRLNG